MNCKPVQFCGIFILLFFINSLSYAQTNNDSTTDSAGATMVPDSSAAYNIGDTTLTQIIFDHSDDSVSKWKSDAAFGYMAYIDSLLRKKKNDLKMDTISIDKDAISSKSKTVSSMPTSSDGFFNSFPLKIFLWLIAIFFIGFIVYKLFFKGGLFSKDNTKNENEPTAEEPQKLDDYAAYNNLIQEAELKSDFNMAVRYLYLQSLKKLSDKELILFAPDKTNKTYVQELSKQAYQSEFLSLTHTYEYIWYGKFSINRERYQQIKQDFITLTKKI